MVEPGSDFYEIRKEFLDLTDQVRVFAQVLYAPTKGDTSLHPGSRGILCGQLDAVVGILLNMKDFLQDDGW